MTKDIGGGGESREKNKKKFCEKEIIDRDQNIAPFIHMAWMASAGWSGGSISFRSMDSQSISVGPLTKNWSLKRPGFSSLGRCGGRGEGKPSRPGTVESITDSNELDDVNVTDDS